MNLRSVLRGDNPERLVAHAMRWLQEHPDAPLIDRVPQAIVIGARGDTTVRCAWGDVAKILGDDVSAGDCLQAMLALRERKEMVS